MKTVMEKLDLISDHFGMLKGLIISVSIFSPSWFDVINNTLQSVSYACGISVAVFTLFINYPKVIKRIRDIRDGKSE